MALDLYSSHGGLRPLDELSASDIASLSAELRPLFDTLRAAQVRHAALKDEHAAIIIEMAELDRRIDDLTAARNADYPPITADEARVAVQNATRARF
jgi:hypothetical protein